jgi:hypothetical protein
MNLTPLPLYDEDGNKTNNNIFDIHIELLSFEGNHHQPIIGNYSKDDYNNFMTKYSEYYLEEPPNTIQILFYNYFFKNDTTHKKLFLYTETNIPNFYRILLVYAYSFKFIYYKIESKCVILRNDNITHFDNVYFELADAEHYNLPIVPLAYKNEVKTPL